MYAKILRHWNQASTVEQQRMLTEWDTQREHMMSVLSVELFAIINELFDDLCLDFQDAHPEVLLLR